MIDGSALGFPLDSINDIPAGTYTVQALLHRYETFKRGDGHTREDADGPRRGPAVEAGARQPLLARRRQITIDPRDGRHDRDHARPDHPADRAGRRTRNTSSTSASRARCSRSSGAGRCTSARTCCCRKAGTRIPTRAIRCSSTTATSPPTFDRLARDAAGSEPQARLRRALQARRATTASSRNTRISSTRTGPAPNFPRAIVIEIQHANPFYDDSYAVNSANIGPYGDAIVKELLPYLEKKYRGLGQGWARFMYGGSTGGWEAMAAQVFYPDAFNGAYIACPDPIDFRAYTVVDIYKDKNAYWLDDTWKKTPRPGASQLSRPRRLDGRGNMNRLELVLGTKTRSGQQWDIWEAVFSPGRPRRLSGAHLRQAHRRHRQEGRRVLARALRPDAHPAARLGQGPRQEARRQAEHLRRRHGQLLPEQRRVSRRGVPASRRRIRTTTAKSHYGDRAEHCWNGDHTRPNALSRLRYHQMFIPKGVERMQKTAPAGADLKSWRY